MVRAGTFIIQKTNLTGKVFWKIKKAGIANDARKYTNVIVVKRKNLSVGTAHVAFKSVLNVLLKISGGSVMAQHGFVLTAAGFI